MNSLNFSGLNPKVKVTIKQNVMNKSAFIVALILLFASPQKSLPQDSSAVAAPEEVGANGNAWQVFLRAQALKDYANYKGCPFAPVTEVTITYRKREPNRWTWQSVRKYETLWFSSGRAIGCKRYERLQLKPQSIGNIVTQRSPQTAEHMDELANSIVRLVLDLHVNNVELDGAVIPSEYYDQLCTAMSHMNFYPKTIITDERGLLLRLAAFPTGRERYFYYRSK
jgi:hypothetical protein